MRLVTAGDLRTALPMSTAIDALERAFRDEDPDAGAPLRTSVDTGEGTLLVMPATGPAGTGVKLVTLTAANPAAGLPFIHASYVLFAPGSQVPEALIDGGALTALRTAAVSGLATRWLARPDASRLVVFGAGVQARSHIEAMRAVRPITEVTIVSRDLERAETLAAEVDGRVGTVDDVATADIVCTCTTSPTPLFDGAVLAPGAHINAVGAYTRETRELDTRTIAGSRVAVETRSVALAEAGDILIPIGQGATDAGHVIADLAEVVSGATVRRSLDDVTVFKSVGMAFEDLVVARAVTDALA